MMTRTASVALHKLRVSVAVRHDDEPQMRHRNVQRDHRSLVAAMHSPGRSKGSRRFSVELTLKPQPPKAVYKGFQLRRCVAKTRRSAKYDSIGPFRIGRRGSSVLGEHPLAALRPTGNVCHNRWRNDIGYPAEPDFGTRFTRSFTDGFGKRFHGAVAGVKRNENVGFRVWHRQFLDVRFSLTSWI